MLTDIFGARATAAVMAEGRYVHRDDADWWVPSGRWEYVSAGEAAADARNRFFARVAQVDPFGSRATIGYLGGDFLLQDEVVDAAGNRTLVTEFDLRVLRPGGSRIPNDNIAEVLLDELGWVKATALRGKGGQADDLGGLTSQASPADDAVIAQLFTAPSSVEVAAAAAQLLDSASSRQVHDLERYRASGGALPPASATIVRERHADPASPLQVSFEYPNGSGKVEMTKVQAEPGPATSTTIAANGTVTLATVDTAALAPPRLRWLGTGRKVVNNKGNVVKEYEPFFSVTHEFETEKQLVAAGVTRIHFYDPIDRLVRVDQPDGSFSRTTYGPWAVVEEDRNDTVLESRWYHERINRLVDVKLVAAGKDPCARPPRRRRRPSTRTRRSRAMSTRSAARRWSPSTPVPTAAASRCSTTRLSGATCPAARSRSPIRAGSARSSTGATCAGRLRPATARTAAGGSRSAT